MVRYDCSKSTLIGKVKSDGMKRRDLVVGWIVCVGFGLAVLTGCGGSSNGGGGGGGTGSAPSITSFTASQATIGIGQSSTLTAVFSNGTGVITPGNIAVTSGTGFSVSPTTSTTYTLTVTGSTGTPATQTAVVTVVPAPVITSFAASPATIGAGQSSTLTAVYAGGTGVITPGNIPVTSNVGVSVSPTTTTTYTLTVTPTTGAAVTMTAVVTVVPAPVITSFTASLATITSGQSSTLTAVFSGGTGVITPGNLSVTSNVGVSVSPSTTTTYTLTVTPTVGTAVTMTAVVTVTSAPVITSFTVNPTNIESGSSSQLTAIFSGGTGVVTPGNFPVTSGTPVSVFPTQTTTYTLTVTPTAGAAVTQTATVTVSPAPVITSFNANPTTISAGSSSTLTAVFSGGTGVITPGNITVTSGTGVKVTPATTTTYKLTVTPAVGAAITQTATVTLAGTSVTVNQTQTGAAVTNQLLGTNMAVWDDFTAGTSAIVDAFQGAGIAALRWPGGSTSDDYHWNGTNSNPANGTAPSPSACEGAYQNSNTNYLNFIKDLEFADTTLSGGYDVALTADYGTNEACTGGGDPNEPANWVKYAYANGGTVSHVTVGNEEYGSWEEDLHTSPHNPTTYAGAVSGASGYYTLIKAQNPNTQVGVIVDANSSCCAAGWDSTVLSNAKGYYDFVEFHYYPQNPGNEGDTFLVQQAAPEFTTNINTIKQELTTAGEPNTPIYVGEMGSVSSNPGKQSWSITQGLFAGEMLGEMMNDGVTRATWWIGFGNCNGADGNDSSSLYGWQNFGAYNIFSDGSGDNNNGSPCTYGGNGSTLGVESPTAVAFQMFSNVAVSGEHVLTPSVAGDATDVRAYAATHSGGTALVLFNLNETTAESVVVSLSSETNSPGITEYTYDKEMYDYTNTSCPSDSTCSVDPNHSYANVDWVGPTTTNLGSQALPLTVTLQPWSMNVFVIQ
jgi:hypothetical protein